MSMIPYGQSFTSTSSTSIPPPQTEPDLQGEQESTSQTTSVAQPIFSAMSSKNHTDVQQGRKRQRVSSPDEEGVSSKECAIATSNSINREILEREYGQGPFLDEVSRASVIVQNALGLIATSFITEKRSFMARCMEGITPDELQDFARFCCIMPLFKTGMELLKENYKKWNTELEPSQELATLLRNQHANLITLAKVLKEVEDDGENEQFLTKLEMGTDFSFDFSGQDLITDLPSLKEAIQAQIGKIKQNHYVFVLERIFRRIAEILQREDQFVSNRHVGGGGYTEGYFDENGMYSEAFFDGDGDRPYHQDSYHPMLNGQQGRLLKDFLGQGCEIERTSLIRSVFTAMIFGMSVADGSNILIDPDGRPKFFYDIFNMPHTNQLINRGVSLGSPFCCALLCVAGSGQPLTPDEITNAKSDLAAINSKMEQVKEFLNSEQTTAAIKCMPLGWMDCDKALKAMQERIDALTTFLNTGNGNLSLRDLALRSIPGFRIMTVLSIADHVMNPSSDRNADQTKKGLVKRVFNHSMERVRDLMTALECPERYPNRLCRLWDDPTNTFEVLVEKVKQIKSSEATRVARLEVGPLTAYETEGERCEQASRKIYHNLLLEAEVDYKGWPWRNLNHMIFTTMDLLLRSEFPEIIQIDVFNSSSTLCEQEDLTGNWQQAVLTLPPSSYGFYFKVPEAGLEQPIRNLPMLIIYLKNASGSTTVARVDYNSIPGKFILFNPNGNKSVPLTSQQLRDKLNNNILPDLIEETGD